MEVKNIQFEKRIQIFNLLNSAVSKMKNAPNSTSSGLLSQYNTI